MPVALPAPVFDRAWRAPANDNAPVPKPARAGTGGGRRRMLGIVTAIFLISGAAMHLVNIQVESVVISHASRTAMIFGLVGLRRITHEEERTEGGQA